MNIGKKEKGIYKKCGFFFHFGIEYERRISEMTRTISTTESEKTKFITRTYSWMGFALLVSAISAFVTARLVFADAERHILSPFGAFLFGGAAIGFWIFAIAELALVFGLSAAIRRISVQTAALGFFAYSVINGITLSSIFIYYSISSISSAFFSTAIMFFTMALYGTTTKKNLATFGKYLMMALIGIIIASVLEFVMAIFFHLNTSALDFVIAIVSVIVFTGLSAYDAQKIRKVAEHSNNDESYQKVSILAALEIYLDFINIFLSLLRIFGRRND